MFARFDKNGLMPSAGKVQIDSIPVAFAIPPNFRLIRERLLEQAFDIFRLSQYRLQ